MSHSLWQQGRRYPLQGIRILDMSIMLPGPLLTRIFAQLGAEVLKVEALPLGDPTRRLTDTSLHELLHKGKQSVAIDLKSPEAPQIIQSLASEADILIENLREGVMKSLGIGFENIAPHNPDLCYFSLRGMSSPQDTHPAHDLNTIANSGLGEWFLENDSPHLSTQFGDLVGGCFVPAIRLLSWLADPQRKGEHIVSYMDQNLRSLFLPRAFDKACEEKGDGFHSHFSGSEPHSRYYRCRGETWVSLNAAQDKHWISFCDLVEKPEWKEKKSDSSIVADLEALFADAPASYWETLAKKKPCCLVAVIPTKEFFRSNSANLKSDPLALCGFPSHPNLAAAPQLGQHTIKALTSAGFSENQIGEWTKSGVTGEPKQAQTA